MRSSSDTSFFGGLVFSVGFHALAGLVFAWWGSAPSKTDGDPKADRQLVTLLPPVQPREEQLRLGIDDSSAKTEAWLGFKEETEHNAPAADIDQSAMELEPGLPGPAAPPSSPSKSSQPAPAPAEQAQPEQVQPEQAQPQPTPPQPTPPEPAPPVAEPIPAPAPSETVEPTQTPPTDIAPAEKPVDAAPPPIEPIKPEPIKPAEVEPKPPAPSPAAPPFDSPPTDSPPTDSPPVDSPPKDAPPSETPPTNEKPTPPEPTPPEPDDLAPPVVPPPPPSSTPPAADSATPPIEAIPALPTPLTEELRLPEPEPKPELPEFDPADINPDQPAGAVVPPPPPPSAPAPPAVTSPEAVAPAAPPSPPPAPAGADARPGEKADREADPTSVKPIRVERFNLGKVLAGQGVNIRTTRPRWSTTTLITATSPKNPVVRVKFSRQGKVMEAVFVDDQGSGYENVDAPLMHAIHQWTASGKALSDLPVRDPNAGLTIVFVITLR